MTVAIAAASGRLGSYVVAAVLALIPPAGIVGLARTPDKAKHLGIEVRPGDYDDRGTLESSLQSVDTLLLVSGMDAPERRIEQHRYVIAAARNAGVRKIVCTSVQGAERATAFAPIVQSNRQTEEDVRRSGLDWVIGRNGIDAVSLRVAAGLTPGFCTHPDQTPAEVVVALVPGTDPTRARRAWLVGADGIESLQPDPVRCETSG